MSETFICPDCEGVRGRPPWRCERCNSTGRVTAESDAAYVRSRAIEIIQHWKAAGRTRAEMLAEFARILDSESGG